MDNEAMRQALYEMANGLKALGDAMVAGKNEPFRVIE